jgi:invasion protein IalB
MRMWPILALLLTAPAMAQPQRAAPAQATPAQAPAAPEAERSTASFGDWTVRCERIAGPPPRRQCEMTQGVQAQQQGAQAGQPQVVAQWAVGRMVSNEAFRLVTVLPVNISFAAPVRMITEGDPPLTLAFTRCVPIGCFAEVALTADALRRLRARAPDVAGRVEFRDAGDREIGLPVSFRGFAQALAALEGS